MKHFIIVFLSVLFISAQAQTKVWVLLTDKPLAKEQLKTPEKFLSPRAIERRQKQNIKLHVTDVPVDRTYISTIEDLNFKVERSSKWINAVVVEVKDNSDIELLNSLSFVERIERVASMKRTEAISFERMKTSTVNYYNYGNATNQIRLTKGNYLHENGFSGEGMLIAVIDGGFTGVDLFPAFDSLWMNDRIVATYDFIDNDTNVFHLGYHGMSVLSTMAAFSPGDIVGTAPRAEYALLKSEDQSQETQQEEHNWIAAAEFADSIGADLINSSLGYNTFDGGVGDYTYADMDGRTTISSQGAVWAHRKGILVCNSIGNEGSSSWRKLITPSDVDSILSVGGTDDQGNYVSFSSQGPSYDGRLKPNVVAQAQAVAYTGINGTTTFGNGTSFSSPTICGLAACLWQGRPGNTYMDIIEAIEESSHKYFNPDTLYGHGIPNFSNAFWILNVEENKSEMLFSVYPQPFKDHIYVQSPFNGNENINIKVLDLNGGEVLENNYNGNGELIDIMVDGDIPNGVYILMIEVNSQISTFKIIH